jgi:hypothetical protein
MDEEQKRINLRRALEGLFPGEEVTPEKLEAWFLANKDTVVDGMKLCGKYDHVMKAHKWWIELVQ